MREDMIAYWARLRPDSLAMAGHTGAVTYRAFDEAINKVARSLGALDLPAKGLVAVQISQTYRLYLLERSLDRIGLTSVVLPLGPAASDILNRVKPDVILADPESSISAHRNATAITTDLMIQALKGPVVPPPEYRPRPEDIVRVVLSSGTTGMPKRIPISRASLEGRCRIRAITEGIGQSSRLLLTVGPDTSLGLTFLTTFWNLGAMVMLFDPRRAYQEIVRLQPTYVCMSTGQLKALLREMPDNAGPIAGLRVSAGGSQVSPALAGQVMRRLSEDFWINYGCGEQGAVATAHASILTRHDRAVGYLAPGLEMQVVDADGAPVARGQTGILRMRGEANFSGYLENDETTRSAWHDGWFYSGDYGALTADGLVLIEGRIAELMNLGGMKIDPAAVDETARTCIGVADAAAFSIANALGVDKPWIAVVNGEDFNAPRLIAHLSARWPDLRNIEVVIVDAIPRNGMFKVERRKLQQTIDG